MEVPPVTAAPRPSPNAESARARLKARESGTPAEPKPLRLVSARAGASWHDEAACRHEDPELFFPIGTTGPAILQVEEAREVCRGCPVKEPCLQWALECGVDHGVWGGLTEDERRSFRRRQPRPRSRRFV